MLIMEHLEQMVQVEVEQEVLDYQIVGSPAPTTSPLANPTGLPVAATGYPVTVGAGGAGKPSSCSGNYGPAGNPGSNSVFAGSSTITSAGGGGAGGTGSLGSPGRS